ncbi:E3 ubiquitin-protein ligase WAV3-like [Triticum urartu]|uniref:E3 ubiquitin-protein ligase WAV3-like n=1 Tax=Triticum urartu TaxID=4572 RepID=UPI0020443F6A|nr:E3 ubiquitin-protein ligase WAV3-like [Triticum urartu]
MQSLSSCIICQTSLTTISSACGQRPIAKPGAAMESNSSTCAICNGDMCRGGGGGSGFTADCSHQFHYRCVSGSLASSRQACPLCSARCRDLPSFRSSKSSTPSQPPPASRAPAQPFFRPMEPRVFDDDDPVLRAPRPLGDRQYGAASATSSGSLAVALSTHCEYSSLARDAPHENFAVLVHARAPGTSGAATGGAPPRARAPIDLVTVLDVSGSMVGSKLALLKQAMGFVVDSLGPADRLCVVSFSSGANRLMRLARMSESDGGKDLAKRAVQSLAAGGGTNIGAALRKAAKVLDDRLHRNAVASVILLSDGQDTYTVPRRGRDANYDALVPPSFMYTGAGNRSAPVHTFGFGTDHDAAAMHTIAEATGGTFSFIENEADIQDAFAQCIGGLLSVAVQELRVDIACPQSGVRVRSVNSGCYRSHINVDGRSASIDVGELYADEERRFLLLMDVPRARSTTDVTHLMQVSCAYRDMVTGRPTNVDGEDALVLRPSWAVSLERCAEVERERVRLAATDGIAAARAAAERGAHEEAAEILQSGQRAVARSAAARAGDSMCVELSRDLQEMSTRVADRRRYELSGRAYMLAGLSSHAQQRATSRQMSGDSGTTRRRAEADLGTTVISTTGATASYSYVTPAMMDMLDRSRRSREMTALSQQRSKERRRSAHY